MYASADAECYGLFLLRRGQEHSSRRLLERYRGSGIKGAGCKSIEVWEKQMEGQEVVEDEKTG